MNSNKIEIKIAGYARRVYGTRISLNQICPQYTSGLIRQLAPRVCLLFSPEASIKGNLQAFGSAIISFYICCVCIDVMLLMIFQ